MNDELQPGKEKEEKVPFLSIFLLFFKIGSVTFGGGLAMLPLLQVELVDRKRWLNNRAFSDCLTVAQSVPGPIVVNLSLVAGYRMLGLKGSLSAMLGVTLPSFSLLLVIAMFLWQYRENPLAHAAFQGIGPAVTALIAAAAIKLGKANIKGYPSFLLLVLFLGLLLLLNLHPLYVIICGFVVGFWFQLRPNKKKE